jgi:hypothetical protein
MGSGQLRAGGLMQGMRIGPGEHGVIQFTKKANGRYADRVRFRDHAGQWRSVQATAESKSAARRRAMEALGRELQTSGSGEYTSKSRSRTWSRTVTGRQAHSASTDTCSIVTYSAASVRSGFRRSLRLVSTTSSKTSGAQPGTRRRSYVARSPQESADWRSVAMRCVPTLFVMCRRLSDAEARKPERSPPTRLESGWSSSTRRTSQSARTSRT